MATFRKRTKADGTIRWQAIIRRNGQEFYETFPTKTAAQAWAREQESKIERRGYNAVRDFQHTRCRELLDEYCATYLPTLRGYRNALTRFTKLRREAQWVNKGITRISPYDLSVWRDVRMKHVQPSSVNREMNDVSAFFTWVIKQRHVPIDNPMRSVSRPAGADVKRDRTFTWQELKKILKALGYRHKPSAYTGKQMAGHCFLLALRTAMRIGEIASIEWRHIHLADQWLHLPVTKNGLPRDVPLSTQAVRLLRRMNFDEPKLVPVRSDSLGIYFREAAKLAGVDDVHFHDSRHHATTQLAEKLTNTLELSAVTGHQSLKHLKRYYNPKASVLAKKLG